jgi:hypothetical protein
MVFGFGLGLSCGGFDQVDPCGRFVGRAFKEMLVEVKGKTAFDNLDNPDNSGHRHSLDIH